MTFKKLLGACLAALAVAVFVADPAFAQTPPAKIDSGDTAWMLTSTALVLMMTIPGLGLFYGGMVRKKNVLSVVTQVFAVCCLMSVLWFVAGYSLALSENADATLNAYIGGFSKAMLAGVTNESITGSIPEWLFAVFQMTFAVITPALIVGAFAERIKFSALLLFTALWLFFVYVPVAHWVWGGGFLGSAGVLDFAGGTVVHINAGVAGLVGAIIIGKRVGYGTASMPPHNLTLSFIGAALLWVGWFGFNAGSAAAANSLASVAMLNTQVATAMAALAWMFAEWIIAKRPSLLGILSGAIAGLVAITPAAGFVNPTGSLCIGLVAGVGCYIASVPIKKALGYDDSLDVFGVHAVGGIIGAILTGVFADAAINEAAKDASVALQFYGVAVTIVYTAIVSAVLYYIVHMVVGLRPPSSEEEMGLDVSQHGESVQ